MSNQSLDGVSFRNAGGRPPSQSAIDGEPDRVGAHQLGNAAFGRLS